MSTSLCYYIIRNRKSGRIGRKDFPILWPLVLCYLLVIHESLDEHSAGVPFGIAVVLHINAVQLNTGDLVQRLADILRIR